MIGRVSASLLPPTHQYTCFCTLCSLQFTVYSLQFTVYSLQFTVYSLQCTVYSVQCTVQSVHCIMQCTVCSDNQVFRIVHRGVQYSAVKYAQFSVQCSLPESALQQSVLCYTCSLGHKSKPVQHMDLCRGNTYHCIACSHPVYTSLHLFNFLL